MIILANSANPDGMSHSAAFHLGLHCLPNYFSTVHKRLTTTSYIGQYKHFIFSHELVNIF